MCCTFFFGFSVSIPIKQKSQGLLYAEFLNNHFLTIFLTLQYKKQGFPDFVWALLVCNAHGPPIDSEIGLTVELGSKTNLLKWQNSEGIIFKQIKFIFI